MVLLLGFAGMSFQRWPIRRDEMLRWAIILAVVAVIAAMLGFGGVAGLSAELAKIFLLVAVVLIVLGFLFGRGRKLP